METDDLRGELIRSLGHIYQLEAFSALEAMLQGESLVLQALAERREAAHPSALSRELRLSPSRITGTLSSLRRKGFVVMEPSEEDRRMIRVSITAAGLCFIGQQMARMETYFDQMLKGLGRGDAEALIALIERCVAVMEA